MSLKVWLPLTGDLHNQGCSNIEIIDKSSVVNANGKIGSCYYFSAASYCISFPWIFNTSDSCSAACWFKLDSVTSSTQWIFNCNAGGGNANTHLGIYITTSGILYTVGTVNATYSTTIQANTWYHIALCLDTVNNKKYLYLNGEQLVNASYSGAGYTTTYCTIGARRNGTGYNYGMIGYANDFRLYDHCLSAAEVKEISQGLVLHYKLDSFQDGNGKPNLGNTSATYSNQSNGVTVTANTWGGDAGTVTFYHSGGYNGLPYKIYHKTATGSGGIYKKTADDIVIESGTTYTMSCWIKADRQFTASNYSFNINRGVGNRYITYGSGFTIYTDWHFYSKTFTATDDDAGSYGEMSIIYDDAVTDYYVYYSGFKIEKNTTATPWCSPNISLNTIQDNSGYNYNGTLLGIPLLDTDTARYSYSINFPTNADGILTTYPLTLWNNAFTYSFWIKPSSENGGRSIYAASYSGASCSIEKTTGNKLRFYWNGSPDLSTSSLVISDGSWQHIAVVKEENKTTVKCYYNGELKDTFTNTFSDKTFTGSLRIARDTRGDSTSYTGLMSDFRIYATALSANDIKQLYQVGAKIDNLQNLHTFEIKETNKNLLAGKVWTSTYSNHNPTAAPFTNFNSKGEYQFVTNSTSAGTEYIPINPSGHTYEYDYTISVNAGNQFYIGFERYDANKTARSNNACVYTYATKPSSDVVRQHFTGTVNLSTDGVNECRYIALRILNGWSGTTSGVTGTATIHNISLREIGTKQIQKLTNRGQFIEEELKEESNTRLYKNGIIETNNLIER